MAIECLYGAIDDQHAQPLDDLHDGAGQASAFPGRDDTGPDSLALIRAKYCVAQNRDAGCATVRHKGTLG